MLIFSYKDATSFFSVALTTFSRLYVITLYKSRLCVCECDCVSVITHRFAYFDRLTVANFIRTLSLDAVIPWTLCAVWFDEVPNNQ